jgi:hypothetical protein
LLVGGFLFAFLKVTVLFVSQKGIKLRTPLYNACTSPIPFQEPASPSGSGASRLFKLFSFILLLAALASSVYSFAPSLPVAALAVAVGSLSLPAAHRSRTDTLLLWLFKTSATATVFTQAAWLLWYGPARLLRRPSVGGALET